MTEKEKERHRDIELLTLMGSQGKCCNRQALDRSFSEAVTKQARTVHRMPKSVLLGTLFRCSLAPFRDFSSCFLFDLVCPTNGLSQCSHEESLNLAHGQAVNVSSRQDPGAEVRGSVAYFSL